MNKKDSTKLLKGELEKYVNSLDLQPLEGSHIRFKKRLDEAIEKKVTKQKKYKDFIKYLGIGVPLFVTGFIIARLTLPVSLGVKGIDEKYYITNIPTTIVEITSEEKFSKIVNYSISKGIKFEFAKLNNAKQLYIKGIRENQHFKLKELLDLNKEYKGPITLIIK